MSRDFLDGQRVCWSNTDLVCLCLHLCSLSIWCEGSRHYLIPPVHSSFFHFFCHSSSVCCFCPFDTTYFLCVPVCLSTIFPPWSQNLNPNGRAVDTPIVWRLEAENLLSEAKTNSVPGNLDLLAEILCVDERTDMKSNLWSGENRRTKPSASSFMPLP